MAKANPFRFSTKYQDDETDLLYYGYRYYNASTGRWLSRDPSAVRDGNEYLFVRNNSLSGYDMLGLWYADVHKDMTAQWAKELGVDPTEAEDIGLADARIDDDYPVYDLFNPLNGGVNDWVWGWHFNRSLAGDSRLKHRDVEVGKAQKFCSVADDPVAAAIYLGRALHPLQDTVAHGDYNRKAELPNPSFWGDLQMLWHNYAAGFSPYVATYPDAPALDANGPHGIPTADVMRWTPTGGGKVGYTQFHGGKQRIKYTEEISKELLKDFQQFVRDHAKPCGECRKAYLTY